MASGGSRSGAGRKRKSPELKVVTGTFREDRDAKVNEDVPLGPMIAPLHLSEIARGHFSTIADILEQQKRSSPHYAEHVGLLAIRLEQVAMYQAVLEIEGSTYRSETRVTKDDEVTTKISIRAHPAAALLSEALRHAQSLLGDLMLNPSAALKIASGHKQEAGDFDDF
tara:strand:+ start:85 stop:588 length:504 start_codon:yes stop_codon:yes gene_type:complete